MFGSCKSPGNKFWRLKLFCLCFQRFFTLQQIKRKLADVAKKLDVLYDKLREGSVSDFLFFKGKLVFHLQRLVLWVQHTIWPVVLSNKFPFVVHTYRLISNPKASYNTHCFPVLVDLDHKSGLEKSWMEWLISVKTSLIRIVVFEYRNYFVFW